MRIKVYDAGRNILCIMTIPITPFTTDADCNAMINAALDVLYAEIVAGVRLLHARHIHVEPAFLLDWSELTTNRAIKSGN